MSKKTVSDMILDKFAQSIKTDESFNDIYDELVKAVKEKQTKAKIKAIMRKTNETNQP